MHPLTGNKALVLDTLGKTIQAFQDDGAAVRQAMTDTLQPASEADRQQARTQILDRLQSAYQAEQARPVSAQDAAWYVPPVASVANLQSAMSQHLGPTPESSQKRGVTNAAGVAGPDAFTSSDPRWIEAVVDALITSFRGKANFVTHVNLTDFMNSIEDRCKIALVGDWGADTPSAAKVGHQIQSHGADYVIHLGDIYYAGQGDETEGFLARWPQAGQKRSFALNGNHEMYSGGRAYFEKVLPAFGQSASYFGLYNRTWQFLSADTAYVEQRLLSEQDARLTKQFDWLVDKLKNAGRRSVLVTHHQPLSAFAPDHAAAANLRNDVAQLTLAVGSPSCIFGWFFGHEHRCTLYDDNYTEYRARLIGNGSMPMSIPAATPDRGCVPFRAINRTRKPHQGQFLTCGFALLSLDGPMIAIEYINEDGSVWQKEWWLAG